MRRQQRALEVVGRQLGLFQRRTRLTPNWRQLPKQVKEETLPLLAQLLDDAWARQQMGHLSREVGDE
jgi:hypothetical protein